MTEYALQDRGVLGRLRAIEAVLDSGTSQTSSG
jgi:hypothetical protein